MYTFKTVPESSMEFSKDLDTAVERIDRFNRFHHIQGYPASWIKSTLGNNGRVKCYNVATSIICVDEDFDRDKVVKPKKRQLKPKKSKGSK